MDCDQCSSCFFNAINDGSLKDIRQYISSSKISDGQRFTYLCHALKNNQTAVTKLLLQNGFKDVIDRYVFRRPDDKVHPFQLALENSNMEIVEMLLAEGSEISSYFASELLCNTVEKTSEDCVKFLLNKGANVNYKRKSGATSLNLAVLREHLKIVEHLLINGGNVNSRYPGKNDTCLLHVATMKRNKAMVKLLLKFGADANACRKNGSTALHTAVEISSLDIVKYLLNEGATVNFTVPLVPGNFSGKQKEPIEILVKKSSISAETMFCTPIEIAIDVGHEKIVELLLDYGVDIDTQNYFGKTVLQLAVEKGCLSIIKHVLHHCPDLDNEANKKAFYYAAKQNFSAKYKRIFRELVQYGYTVSPEDVSNWKLFKYVVRNNYFDIVEKLIEYGIDINHESPNEWGICVDTTVLYSAVLHECEETVEVLLNHGADVKRKNSTSLVSLAVEKGNLKITKLLLQKRADFKNNFDILAIAVEKGCLEMVEILLNNGAHVNSKLIHPSQHDEYCGVKKSALFVAAEGGYVEIVDLLLKYGAEVDLGKNDGTTPLMIAAEKGNLKIVESLLKYRASIDCYGPNPLYNAVKKGHHEVVELLLKCGARIESKTRNSEGLIITSASEGHLKTVEVLLKAGAEVDKKTKHGTALYMAARKGYDEVVKVLLKNGATVDSKPDYKYDSMTPLLIYSERGQLEFVEILLALGASISSTDEFDRTALHLAAMNSHEDVVKKLLQCNANIDAKDKFGMTALLVSAEVGSCKITEILLENGACIETCDRYGRTTLFIAVEESHEEMIELLLKRGAEINCRAKTNIAPFLICSERGHVFGKRALRDLESKYTWEIDEDDSHRKALSYAWGPDGGEVDCVHDVLHKYSDNLDDSSGMNITPLIRAVTKGNLKCLELVLKAGADPELRGSNGKTALCTAVEKFHPERVEILLRYGAKVDSVFEGGKTPLIISTEKSCESKNKAREYSNKSFEVVQMLFIENMEFLLHFGANTESITVNGKTALDIAVENENLEAVKVLLEYGANADRKNKDMMTPLIINAKQGNVEMVAALLKFGASINTETPDGRTALNIAAETGHLEIVNLLLENGADVDSKNKENMTPLHFSSKNGNLEIVEAALKFSAAIDSTNDLGETPLYLAAKFGQIEVAKHLLKFGSKVDFMSTNGMTPLVVSVQLDQPKMVKLLLENGAKTDDFFYKIAQQVVLKKSQTDILQTILECGSVDEKIVCKTNVRRLLDLLNQEAVPNNRDTASGLNSCAKVVVHHIIKMEAANMFTSEDKLVAVSYNDEVEINDFRNKCEAEIAKMKINITKNTNISYYDVLSKPISQLARIANNGNILQVFKSDIPKSLFPIYANILNSQFQKGQTRKKLLDKGTQICHSLYQHFSMLPYDLIEFLLSYTSNEDLRNIVRCWNITVKDSKQFL